MTVCLSRTINNGFNNETGFSSESQTRSIIASSDSEREMQYTLALRGLHMHTSRQQAIL